MPRTPIIIALISILAGSTLFAFVLWFAMPTPPPPVTLPSPQQTESPAQILERKQLFIALLLPIVQAENKRLLIDRARITRIEQELTTEDDISRDDFEWLKKMAGDYNLDPAARRNPEFFNSLRRRVDILPAALIIAQAAIESGWGRAQIARETNNFFGHYCYDKACGAPAPGAGDLRTFRAPGDSVRAYMHNINSHPAYRQLRTQRENLRAAGQPLTGSALANYLTAYSERGDAYVADVHTVIRANLFDELPNL